MHMLRFYLGIVDVKYLVLEYAGCQIVISIRLRVVYVIDINGSQLAKMENNISYIPLL